MNPDVQPLSLDTNMFPAYPYLLSDIQRSHPPRMMLRWSIPTHPFHRKMIALFLQVITYKNEASCALKANKIRGCLHVKEEGRILRCIKTVINSTRKTI